jgi:hypothetical protein
VFYRDLRNVYLLYSTVLYWKALLNVLKNWLQELVITITPMSSYPADVSQNNHYQSAEVIGARILFQAVKKFGTVYDSKEAICRASHLWTIWKLTTISRRQSCSSVGLAVGRMIGWEWVSGVLRMPVKRSWYENLTTALEIPYAEDIVFADLRQTKIMITKDEHVMYIEFDSCGAGGLRNITPLSSSSPSAMHPTFISTTFVIERSLVCRLIWTQEYLT